MKTPKNKNTRQIIASLALIVGAVGVGAGASYAAAPSTDAPTETVAPAEDQVAPEELEGEVIYDTDEEIAAFLDSLTPAEKADLISETEAVNAEIVAALDEAGIAYELVTDPVLGIEMPAVDCEDEAAQKVVNDVSDAHMAAVIADAPTADA